MIEEGCLNYGSGIHVVTSADSALPPAVQPKIAVQVHIFHDELIDEIGSYLGCIPYKFDCFVSTDSQEKADLVTNVFSKIATIGDLRVEVFENIGRDVAPFIVQMSSRISGYDFLCHIHTKKSLTVQFGDSWRRYLLENLLGNKGYVSRILEMFEQDPSLGIVMPDTFPIVQSCMDWGGSREMVETLLAKVGINGSLPEKDLVFPAGNMFWARVEAILPLFELGLALEDFPQEANQTNNTLAHAIERVWCFLALGRGYRTQRVLNRVGKGVDGRMRRLALYVHFDEGQVISLEDKEYLRALKGTGTDIVFISNGGLSEESQQSIAGLVREIRIRENKGYDFGAWKDYILSLGREGLEGYDQTILCNNSCIGPICDLNVMFGRMLERGVDFWGITLYPFHDDATCLNPDDDGSGSIPEHIQSYFLVLGKRVTSSDAFWSFWERYDASDGYLSTILNGELAFTEYLANHGFTYGAYLTESLDIGAWLGTEQPQNELGLEYAVLGSPFIKKKNRVFLAPRRKQSLVSLMEQMACPQCMSDYFSDVSNDDISNDVLESVLAKAHHNKDALRKGKPPKEKEPPVEDSFWYVVENYVVDFSKDDCMQCMESETITLNWIVPPMGIGSGGHVTLFRFISGLEERGFHSRFYLYGTPRFSDDGELRAFLAEHYAILDSRVEAFNDVHAIKFAHISIATEWKTAYFLKRFNNTLEKCYFVQDFEPFFYPHGSEYLFAENTYKFGFSAITAGDWLKDVMAEKYGMTASSFLFSANRDIYHPKGVRTDIPKVFFYSRPVTPRRDFELGMLALNELCKLRPDVVVEFAGWDVSEFVIPFQHTNHGIVSSEELATIYSQCDLCLVLSATNLSLVPLEVMACGSVAVCSDGPNSTWLVNANNGVIVPEDPVEIARILDECLGDKDFLAKKRREGMEFAKQTSWEKEIDKVADALIDKYITASEVWLQSVYADQDACDNS